MTEAAELLALYQQWRRLTEEEGQAIQAAAWTRVQQYQAAKARLQPRIVEVSRRLDPLLLEREFRPLVEELIELERRNDARLREQRDLAEHQKEQLDRSSRHLRQLHKSYVPRARTHWQSYS